MIRTSSFKKLGLWHYSGFNRRFESSVYTRLQACNKLTLSYAPEQDVPYPSQAEGLQQPSPGQRLGIKNEKSIYQAEGLPGTSQRTNLPTPPSGGSGGLPHTKSHVPNSQLIHQFTHPQSTNPQSTNPQLTNPQSTNPQLTNHQIKESPFTNSPIPQLSHHFPPFHRGDG